MLVTYVPKRLKEGRELDVMLSSASWIAGQILREGEPLQAVGESQGPPTGVAAFPPPPPATKPAVEEKSEVKLRAAPDPVEAPTYTRASVPPPSAH
jgi:hypothetical protein